MLNNTAIYLNEKCIFFTEDVPSLLAEENLTNAIIINSLKEVQEIDAHFDELQLTDIDNLIIKGDPKEGLAYFKSKYSVIQAAGGIVENDQGELLMIYRNNRWDLPKGKLDEGESIEECALREVQEETGIRNIELDDFHMKSYHMYVLKDSLVLKETSWYSMFSTDEELVNQIEEGITKVLWIHVNNLEQHAQKAYRNVSSILKEWL